MPLISVEATHMSKEGKEKLCRRLTRDASEIMGIPEATFMMFVKEYPTDSIATGGVTLENKSK